MHHMKGWKEYLDWCRIPLPSPGLFFTGAALEKEMQQVEVPDWSGDLASEEGQYCSPNASRERW